MPERLVIIDTQSLLDWLVFRDPACQDWDEVLLPGRSSVERALTSDAGAERLNPVRWTWIGTAEMKSEFDHVVAGGLPARRTGWAEAAASAWASAVTLVEAPPALAPTVQLRCSDPDDQKFIDLAMARGACHLVTRDKALLKLARRAAERRGVHVCTPVTWNGILARRDMR